MVLYTTVNVEPRLMIMVASFPGHMSLWTKLFVYSASTAIYAFLFLRYIFPHVLLPIIRGVLFGIGVILAAPPALLLSTVRSINRQIGRRRHDYSHVPPVSGPYSRSRIIRT